jgi:probable H4MPT-linked C1 transfer pathway protein
MTGTTRIPATAAATLAVDVGGANTKAAWLDGQSLRTVTRPFELWRDRAALSAVLRDVAAEVAGGPAHAAAITMTAELSDAFRTKREGVMFVLDAAQHALGGRPLSVLTTAGELVSVEAARARPWDVAAANWVATALAVADAHPDALLVDVGSTTADIVPIAAGRVAATGHNDLERLLAGELVYTGVLRTNLAAIAPRVPIRGDRCPVSSESFAISADMHLVLGHLAPEAYACPTPDGRPATVEFARERIARLVCADVEQLDEGEVDAIAAFLFGEQLRQLEDAARRVGRRLPPAAPVVAVGSGAFLGRAVAARLGRTVAAAPAPWGATGGEVAPAAALAALLATRAHQPC